MSQTPIWDELVAKLADKISGPTERALAAQEAQAELVLTYQQAIDQMIADDLAATRRVREMFRRMPDPEPRVIGQEPATVQFNRARRPVAMVVHHVTDEGETLVHLTEPGPAAPGWLAHPFPTPDVIGTPDHHIRKAIPK